MPPTEYLSLFSNQGSTKVEVKFKDFDGVVSNQFMVPNEINRLILHDTGEFSRFMTFDDWLFEIYQYSIDPIKNTLTIYARKIKDQE